jgi:drug/metabolite transporter (DMT)-like permease
MKNKRLLGLGCAFFSTMCWASNYPVFRLIFNRGGIDDLDEWWSSWLRTFLCLVVMFPFAFTQKADGLDKFRKNWKQDWKIFLFLGMMLVLEASVCFAAAKYTTAARTSLFANTSPVFTLLISFLFAKEVLTGRKITGILMGLAGIVLAAFSRGSDAFTTGLSTLGGDLLAILSGVFWALFTVFGGDASSKYNGAFCTVIYRAFGSLVLIPVLFFCNVELNLPWKVWMGLLYLAVIPGGIAVWVWSIAQKYVEPGVLGSFGYLSAFSATLFSVLFLEEKITLPFILAFVLILGGMALIIRQSRKEKETKTV